MIQMVMCVNCLLLLTATCIQQHRCTKILFESVDEHLDYLDYFYDTTEICVQVIMCICISFHLDKVLELRLLGPMWYFFLYFYWSITALQCCQFLVHNEMNQPYVYIYPFPLESPFHPSSHPSRPSQSTELSFLCCTAASHQPSISHDSVKGICQGCILSPCLFNLYAEYIMRNAGLDEAQAGIKIARRNINNLRCADETTLCQKVKRNYRAS